MHNCISRNLKTKAISLIREIVKRIEYSVRFNSVLLIQWIIYENDDPIYFSFQLLLLL